MSVDIRRPKGMNQAEAIRWSDLVEEIMVGFEYEDCDECGQGLDHHIISPDALDLPHAWCKTGGDR